LALEFELEGDFLSGLDSGVALLAGIGLKAGIVLMLSSFFCKTNDANH